MTLLLYQRQKQIKSDFLEKEKVLQGMSCKNCKNYEKKESESESKLTTESKNFVGIGIGIEIEKNWHSTITTFFYYRRCIITGYINLDLASRVSQNLATACWQIGLS